MTLSPNQYLLIGCQIQRDRTIGWNAFTETPGAVDMQRMLVIRSCRPVTAREASENNMDELIRNDPSGLTGASGDAAGIPCEDELAGADM